MSREQFIASNRRVCRYLSLVLLLTACAAVGLALALPAWSEAREWLRASGGEGAAGLLVGLLAEVVVLGPLLLAAFLAARWVDRRFGLRCPGCRRSLTLGSPYRKVLRSGRCGRCRQTLFDPGEGETAGPGAEHDRGRS
jgi:hypothetical protein